MHKDFTFQAKKISTGITSSYPPMVPGSRAMIVVFVLGITKNMLKAITNVRHRVGSMKLENGRATVY